VAQRKIPQVNRLGVAVRQTAILYLASGEGARCNMYHSCIYLALVSDSILKYQEISRLGVLYVLYMLRFSAQVDRAGNPYGTITACTSAMGLGALKHGGRRVKRAG